MQTAHVRCGQLLCHSRRYRKHDAIDMNIAQRWQQPMLDAHRPLFALPTWWPACLHLDDILSLQNAICVGPPSQIVDET